MVKRDLILVFLICVLSTRIAAQEGTKQLMPNSTDQLWLEIGSGTNSAFATPGCAEHNRLNIYMKAGEKLFYGLQQSGSRDYTIRKPDGTAVSGHSSLAIPSSGTGYIATYDEAITGAEGTILNGVTIGAAGYTPLSFTADQTGDYYIEFSGSGSTYIQRFDFTVTDASNNIITNSDNPNVSAGRLWSRSWNLETNSFTLYPVNAYFYVFTSDEFVNKVKFEIIPNSFSFVCNSFGTTTTGRNYIKNAQSQTYNVSTDDIAEYKIFLNDPDQSVFLNSSMAPPKVKVWFEETLIYDYDYLRSPQELDVYNQSIQIPIDKNDVGCGLPNAAVFKIESNVEGWSTIYVDVDGGGFDVDGQDTVIVADVKIGDNYIIWDLKDRAGTYLPDGTYSCSATFLGRGPAHFPLSDVETVSSITTQSIRPFNKLGVTLYWDDKLIDAAGQWGDNNGRMDESQVTQLTYGVTIPRITTYYQDNGNIRNGDQNTLNSWFNAIDLGLTLFDFTVSTSASQCLDGALPMVSDITVNGPKNTSITFTAQDFEDKYFSPNSYALGKIKITSLPSNGKLHYSATEILIGDLPYEIDQANIGNLTYTPDNDWGGQDTYGWNGHNGIGYATNDAQVLCNINVAPTISTIASQNLCINTSLTNLVFTVTDTENDAVLISAYSQNTTLVPNENITLGGTGTNRTISITPATDQTGSTIIYLQADDGLEQVLTSFSVIVGPSITFTGSTEICSSEDLQLVASEVGATSYEWKRGATTVGTSQSLNISSPVTTGSYSLTVVKNGCTAINNFEVSDYPNFSFTGETTVCIGSNVNLSAIETVADSYTWRKGVATIGTQKVLDYTLSATASDFSLEVTKFGCTSTSSNFTLTAIGSPDVSNFSTSASDVCKDSEATVTVLSSTLLDANYTVTYDLTGNNTATGSTATLSFSGGSGTFSIPGMANSGSTTVTITNIKLESGTCNSNVAAGNSDSFTVHALPDVSNLSLNNTGACIGNVASISFGSSSLADGDYELTYDLTGANVSSGLASDMNGFSSASGTFNSAMLDNTGSTTLTLTTIENKNTGCSSAISSNNTTSISVNVIPSLTANSDSSPTTCGGTDGFIVLTTTGLSNGSYTIDFLDAFSSAQTATMVVTGGNTGTISGLSEGTYNDISITEAGCTSVENIDVVLTDPIPPTVTAIADGQSNVCVGSTTVAFTNATAGGVWSIVDGTGSATIDAGGVVTGVSAGNVTVRYTVTSGGCSNAATTALTVDPLPTVAAIADGQSNVCVGSTTAAFTNATAGGVWSIVDGTGSATIDASGVVTGVSAGSVTVRYTVTSGGCSNAAITALTVDPLPTVAAITDGQSNVCVGSTTAAFTNATAGGAWSIVDGTGSATIDASGVVTGVSAGNVTVRYTVTSGGCFYAATTALTIDPLPTVAAIADGQSNVCVGSTTVAFTNATAGGIWSIEDGPGSATINAGGVVTGVSAGSVTVRYTVTSGGCSNAATTALTVNPLPTVAAIADGQSNVCVGSTTVAFTNATAGGVWSIVDGTGSATIDAGGVVTGVSAGSVTVRYTVTSGGCSNAATTALTVDPLPTVAAIAGGQSNVCVGSTTAAFTNATAGGVWSIVDGTGSATIDASGMVTGVSGGSVTVRYTVTSGGCSNAATTALIVDPLPTVAVIAGGQSNVCVSSTTTAFTNATAGGVWSIVNGTGSATIDASGVVTGVSAGSVTIRYTVTSGGCANAATTTLTIDLLPTVAAIADGQSNVCAGSTTVAFTNATAGGVWSIVDGTGSATIDAGGVATGVSAGSVSVRYTVTSGGCSNAATTALTVDPLPTVAAIADGQSNVCVGTTTAAFTNATAGGVWSIVDGTGSATIDASGVVTGVSAGSVTVRYTVTSGGCSNTATTALTVDALPTVAAITGGQSNVCVSSTTAAFTNPTAGGAWSIVNGTGSATIDAGGVVTGVSAGSVTVRYTVTSGGCSNTATTALTIDPLPTVAAIAGGQSNVCVGSTTAAFTNATAGGIWSIVDGTGSATIDASGVVTGVSAGSVTVRYTVTSGGCSNAATTAITVDPLPTVATIAGGQSNVCVGSTTAAFTNATAGGVWSIVDGTGSATIDASGVVTGVSAGSVTVRYTVTSGGCSNAVITVLTIDPLPIPAAITGDTEVCMGNTISNLTAMAGSVAWTSSNTSIATIDASTGLVTPTSPGNTDISYMVTDVNGCSSSSDIHAITVNASPTIGGLNTVSNGSSITLTSTGGAGTWSSSAPAIATVDALGVVTGQSMGSASIIFTLSATGCNVSHNVGVGCAPPSPTFVAEVSVVCAGEVGNVYTTESGKSNYVWNVSAGGTITSGGTATDNSVTVTWNTAGPQTVNVNYEDGGCSAPVPTVSSVTVNAIPTITLVNTTDPANCISTDGSIELSFTNIADGTYTINYVDGSLNSKQFPNVSIFSGSATITGLDAGVYNDLTITQSSCTSGEDVDFTLTCSNVNPVAVDDLNNSTPEDTPITISVIGGNDTDVDGNVEPSTIVLIDPSNATNIGNNSTPLVITGVGTYSVDVSGNVTFTPEANFSGSADINYTIEDDQGQVSNMGLLNITVSPINDAPVAIDELNNSTMEDNPITITAIGDNDSDVDGNVEPSTIVLIDPLNATNTGNNSTPLVITGVGTYTVDVSGNVTFTPEANFNGTADINYTIEDNQGQVSNMGLLNITVSPINDAPIAIDDLNNSTPEDTPITISVIGGNDTDIDGNVEPSTIVLIDPLNATNTGNNSTPLVITGVGTYTVDVSGNVTFTPEANFTGSADINYTIEDNQGQVSNVALIGISASPANDAPVADDDSGATAVGGTVTINIIDGDTDADGTLDLASIVITNETNGTVIDNGDGTVDFTHDGSQTSTGSFTYTIDDNDGLTSNLATVILSITPQNDAPIADNDTGTTHSGGYVTIDIVDGDNDPDGTLDLSSILISNETNCTVIDNGDGTVVLTHDGTVSALASFTYTIKDNAGSESNVATVTVNITIINNPPVANNDSGNADQGAILNGSSLLANDSDPDGDELTINTTPVVDVEHGELTLNTDGTYVYRPDDGFSGSDSFTYEVCDQHGECVTANVMITINSVDFDGDGILDVEEGNGDTDGDGIPDFQDPDSDNDGIPDLDEGNTDTDGDGIRDYKDLDSDGDGIPDAEEGNSDTDNDGIANYKDLDSDGDGRPDSEEIGDCDNDGIPNHQDDNNCMVLVPKGFSPNGDGKHDFWIIDGIEEFKSNHVKVFNRWGNMVFEIDGYNNKDVVWTGESVGALVVGGSEVPDGSYFYLIELGEGEEPLSGYVIINR